MRNEALETQGVRRLRLRVARRPPRGRVLADPGGQLHVATALVAPLACRAPEGDCLEAIRAFGDDERFSEADSADVAARETLEITFPATAGRLGLVLGARQTLLSTYLVYQTLAFMGRRAGVFLAAVERGDVAPERAMGMARSAARRRSRRCQRYAFVVLSRLCRSAAFTGSAASCW